ncbi:S8 family peptidase [Fulvivirga sediminis]|uniref:S8 family peptidase n=1 Tax=Fulvivirga sediminis TaxID=2803949 RepID=A0A937K0V5_9BACT|nr:S8 family peptidase [Fulvivirga sediminis]MBL3657984.1 S8 family peptidase [Fulvivirga sediminis]
MPLNVYKKILYTFVIIFTPFTSYSQQPDSNQWDVFVNKYALHHPNSNNKKIEQSPIKGFFLAEYNETEKERLINNDQLELIRPLDNHTAIFYSENIEACHNLKRYVAVNNKWKYPYDFTTINNPISKYISVKVRDFDLCKNLWNNDKKINIIAAYPETSTFILLSRQNETEEYFTKNDQIIFISPTNLNPKEESSVFDLNLSVNKINYLHHLYPSLNGEKISISIKEQAIDHEDLDLKGRLMNNIEASSSTHATEMATIAAGAGNTSPYNKGVAWGSHIFSSSYLNIFPDDSSFFSDNHIYLQNHSYGTTLENFYGPQAEAYDQFCQEHPDILHVFSVGNSGSLNDSIYTYRGTTGYANLTGNFKMAKNIITVGSIDTLLHHDPYVSKGPAYDGRIKPEISAYSSSGSSSAAALVSGLLATLQQYYFENLADTPPASLLKGILLNSADDAGPEGIDFLTGFGSANAKRGIETLKKQQFISGTISTNEEKNYNLEIPEKVKNLKIMLIWNDPPAKVNANTALVNDLDLSLHQGGSQWLPWVLNSYPHNDSLIQLPKRKEDHLNNVEQITLENPIAGNYEIKVHSNFLLKSQDFHIIYQWDEENQFTWTSPTGSDNMPAQGAVNNYFRWETTFTNKDASLEVTYNHGKSWQIISKEIDLAKGLYQWQPPQNLTIAQARMNINGSYFYTDHFTISRPMTTNIGFNCADSVMLIWRNLPEASGYTIFSTKGHYISPITTTSDTSIILNQNQITDYLLSVAPMLNDTLKGIRRTTFDYRIQGVDCYIANFLAYEDQENKNVYLSLNLGTTYEVSKVIFQRKDGDRFVDIAQITPSSNNITYTDIHPQQGLNHYQAKLILNSGHEIFSPEAAVYFLTEREVLLFPNPAKSNSNISIFTKNFTDETVTFDLYSPQGQHILSKPLLSERNAITLEGLPQGIYIYTVSGRDINYRARLVIY